MQTPYPKQIPEEQAIQQYPHITVEYVETLKAGDAIEHALNLARAYQNSLKMYFALDQGKVALWKAIRERTSHTWNKRHDNDGTEAAFSIPTVQNKLGIQPNDDYDVAPGWPDNATEDVKTWFYHPGINIDRLDEQIRGVWFPHLKKKNPSQSADDIAEEAEAWDAKSKFIRFGRKVVSLERALDLFAAELLQYVYYGGGDIYGVGNHRNYEEIRDDLAYGVCTGAITVDSTNNYIDAPPPSPFLAALMNKPSYDEQINIVETITRGLHLSTVGSEFLYRSAEDHAPWLTDPDVVKPTEYFHEGVTMEWVNKKYDEQAVEEVEKLVGRHMGFNLLAMLDDPKRKDSRSSEQVTWRYWQLEFYSSSFVNPDKKERGTILKYENRRGSQAFVDDANEWQVADTEKGVAASTLAIRLLRGAGALLGANLTTTEDGAASTLLEGSSVEVTEVENNYLTSVGIAGSMTTNLDSAFIGAHGTASNFVDYMEAKGVDIDGLTSKMDGMNKVQSWGSAGLLSAIYGALKIYEKTQVANESLSAKDVNEMFSFATEMVELVGSAGKDDYAKYMLLLGDDVTIDAAKGGISSGFEFAGAVFGSIDAVLTFDKAQSIADKGNDTRANLLYASAGTIAADIAIGLMASGNLIGGSGSAVGHPELLLISVVLNLTAAATAIIGATIGAWSELENWLGYTHFEDGDDSPTDYTSMTTDVNQKYYGFQGDYTRQLSYFQSLRFPSVISTCSVAIEEEHDGQQFQLIINRLKGMTEESEILICALPKSKMELFPLFRIPMTKSKLQNTRMPNGMEFGSQDTLTIESMDGVTANSDSFSLKCSLGSNASGETVFEDYFLSPISGGLEQIKDWGWELLYFPSGIPDTLSGNLKSMYEIDTQTTETDWSVARSDLFSKPIPRTRLGMSVGHEITGQYGYTNAYPNR